MKLCASGVSGKPPWFNAAKRASGVLADEAIDYMADQEIEFDIFLISHLLQE
jgi:hypothetical protein